MRRLSREGLGELLARLRRTRRVIGPTVRDGAIVLDEIEGPDDLPVGWTDAQAPGSYRLRRDGDAVFDGYVVGPDAIKRTHFPAREVLYRAERRPDGRVGFAAFEADATERAFVGVRACDLAADAIQAKVFSGGPFEEPRFGERRSRSFVVAVNCTQPGDLCFCASTGTGPRASEGADLVLTERDEGFLVEARTDAGREVLADVTTEDATDEDGPWLDGAMAEAESKMGRAVETEGLPGLLLGRHDHPRWQEVADRCLACGNCTSVCPTCFCSTTEQKSTLDGSESARVRLWESCFSNDHAYIHGGTFRPEVRDRYRQWLGHKMGTWVAQFGTSGCVGCGRCIAWCPVGIDITEEVAALRAEGDAPAELPEPPAHEAAPVDDGVPDAAEVIAVTRENADTVTLHVRAEGHGEFAHGQFNQLSLPALGEVPISISGHDGAALEHTIRGVGAISRALCALKPGDELGIRGPFGRSWPLERLSGAPVVVVAGGIGLAPLRSALRAMLDDPARFPDVHLFYGARSPDDALYVREMLGWLEEPCFTLHTTVDHATPSWRGNVGVVTRLLGSDSVPEGASAMICGPEIMMRFTIEALRKLGVPDERVWVTMERHMKCATGFCGRCQYGPYFMCKDGPVFRFDTIRALFGKAGV